MKTHYADYVGHACRMFFKFPKGKSQADVMNWNAIYKVFMELPDEDKRIIEDYYTTDYTNEWTVIKKFEKRVARERGLI